MLRFENNQAQFHAQRLVFAHEAGHVLLAQHHNEPLVGVGFLFDGVGWAGKCSYALSDEAKADVGRINIVAERRLAGEIAARIVGRLPLDRIHAPILGVEHAHSGRPVSSFTENIRKFADTREDVYAVFVLAEDHFSRDWYAWLCERHAAVATHLQTAGAGGLIALTDFFEARIGTIATPTRGQEVWIPVADLAAIREGE